MQPINTAILSIGMSGQVFHAPFITIHPGFHFYAVWERTKNIAAEKYPGIKTYRQLELLLEDDAVELVIVNTPNATHFEFARQALMAGKHVIVEKPFTVHSREAEELIRIASELKLVISVFQNRRYDSDFKTVKKIIDENLLGEVVEAEFHFDRYKEEISPKLHKEVPGPGTGVLYDLGSHIIDQALYLFGLPDAVFADLRIIRPVSQVEDYFEVLLYYHNFRVRLHSSYLVKEAIPSYILHGFKGSFLKSRADIQEVKLQQGELPGNNGWGIEPESEQGLLHTQINDENIRQHIKSSQGNYMEYFDSVYRAIRLGEPLAVSANDGLNVIRIIEASMLSHQQKKLIALSK